MSIGILLPLILIVGVMFMMTRSQKTKQRQASEMRSKMEPGTGVRTIGGMYAVVKEVNEETVLLEITDGVHAHFAKSAIGTVLPEDEFNRIVHGIEPEGLDEGSADDTAGGRISLDKSDAAAEDASDGQGAAEDEDEAASDGEAAAAASDGDTDDADGAADGATADADADGDAASDADAASDDDADADDSAVEAVKARGGSPAKSKSHAK